MVQEAYVKAWQALPSWRTRLYRARQQLQAKLAHYAELSVQQAFAFDGVRCDRITANTMQVITALAEG